MTDEIIMRAALGRGDVLGEAIDREVAKLPLDTTPFPATPEGYAAFLKRVVQHSAELRRQREAWEREQRGGDAP